jgi:hypothetical protein
LDGCACTKPFFQTGTVPSIPGQLLAEAAHLAGKRAVPNLSRTKAS